MKRRIIHLSLLSLMICAALLFVQSCQSDEKNSLTMNQNDSSQFLMSLKKDYDSIVSPNAKKKAVSNKLLEDTISTKVIYFDKTEISNNYVSVDITPISKDSLTIATSDLFLLMSECDVSFSIEKTEDTPDSILVNTSDIEKTLGPMIEDSRAYLRAKGMTNAEIDEMLNEYNADESLLVPLVISLASYENDETLEANLHTNKSIFPLLGLSAYAGAGDFNWKKAGRCALETIGFDFAKTAFEKKIIKSGIKIVLKSLAKELLGPVGAVIAVGEFISCYYF